MMRRHRADEAIRVQQQGRGKPLISAQLNDHRIVAVGNTIYYAKGWLTFVDFLLHYTKRLFGPEWGNAELAKPDAERHPILVWYEALSRWQATISPNADGIHEAPLTGAAYCYLGLAYNLYLIKHNVELQSRMIKRLKDVPDFQGAYYELIVANILIRAGFELELEDETAVDQKHCEFSARSGATGTLYWVEAKSRSVAGVLGKTLANGTTSADATGRLIHHIRSAFGKPADGPRLMFIDLNAELSPSPQNPVWFDRAIRRLQASERHRAPECPPEKKLSDSSKL
jgi:hypothetical protein